jgi:hypothetical protein
VPVADDIKIAVVVRDDLEVWQKLNVTAFLASGLASSVPGLIGRAYEDASGLKYHPMFGWPVLVFAAGAGPVRRAFDRARARGLHLAVYTDELFTTGHDVDNRAAVAAVATEDLRLAGFAVTGDRRTVDKALDKLPLHP